MRSADSDDWEELSAVAGQLVAEGFTVWLFDHGHRTPIPTASDYRLITCLRPEPAASRVAVPSTTRRR